MSRSLDHILEWSESSSLSNRDLTSCTTNTTDTRSLPRNNRQVNSKLVHFSISRKSHKLKGRCEMFVAGIFTEIRPVWVGDLETRPKIYNVYVWGLILPFTSWDFCFSAVVYSAKE